MFAIPLQKLSEQQRHDYILKTFVLNRANNTESRRFKRDIDIIKDHHRFLWQDSAAEHENASWEERLARRYYDKLFKEYCIADLTYYKHNKVALRWRIEAEVVSGKGQFQCGCRKCEERLDLRTWEVNFAYMEQGEKRNALVKLRLCAEHSAQLNYKSQKREVKRLKKQQHKERKPHNKEAKKVNQIPADIEKEIPTTTTTTTTDMSDNIWSKKLEIENEQETREKEFERYLEDLLF